MLIITLCRKTVTGNQKKSIVQISRFKQCCKKQLFLTKLNTSSRCDTEIISLCSCTARDYQPTSTAKTANAGKSVRRKSLISSSAQSKYNWEAWHCVWNKAKWRPSLRFVTWPDIMLNTALTVSTCRWIRCFEKQSRHLHWDAKQLITEETKIVDVQ